jgi:hypothetical protein
LDVDHKKPCGGEDLDTFEYYHEIMGGQRCQGKRGVVIKFLGSNHPDPTTCSRVREFSAVDNALRPHV